MDISFLFDNACLLALRRELKFQFDRIPLRARRVSGKKLRNLLRVGVNRLLPVIPAIGYPYMAHISPAGVCNLKCEICPVNDPDTETGDLLSFSTFRKFIDEAGDYLLYIILWSWGEPFLNPEIYRMISYARERNILTVTSSNLNSLKEGKAEKVVESGLDALIIALDGASPETHQKYRRGGDFHVVVENTHRVVEARRKSGAKKPFLNLRMVVSRENEHEVEAFKRLATKLGVDMVSFKAFSTRQPGYSDPRLDERYAPEMEKYRWYRYQRGFLVDRKPKKYWCRFPWTKPTLFPDGRILLCEFDLKNEAPLGNINQQSFQEIWFGEKARKMRNVFQRNRDSFRFCRDCVYDYKLTPGCVIKWEKLR